MAQRLDIETLGSEAWDARMRGDLAASRSAERRLEASDDPAASAWAQATSAARWHAAPGEGALPEQSAVRALGRASAEAALPAMLSCTQAARAALLRFDRAAVDSWIALHAELSEATGAHRGVRWLEAGRLWRAVLDGSAAAALDGADPTPASAGHDPSLLVELTAVRALAALETGELDRAVRLARRASRMGRTESLPQAEYLAGVVLARARRVSGLAHLATGILTALAAVAPRPWRGWVAWELVLAGAAEEARALLGDAQAPPPSERAAAALAALVGAARGGDRREVDRAVAEAAEAAAGLAFARADLAVLHAVLDPWAPDPPSDEACRWRRGDGALVPAAMRGVAAQGAADGGGAIVAYVAAVPGGPIRRVIAAGAGLVRDAERLHPPKGNPGRVERALAALALAGESGATIDDLFRRVYGFAYEPEVHRGIFDVLLHRARGRVQDLAEIRRDADRLALTVTRPLLVPDPRSVQPLEELMLRLVARKGGASAKDAAEALNVPLRSVHRALQRLLDEGACRRSRAGRNVVYEVEDTTFQEPTRA